MREKDSDVDHNNRSAIESKREAEEREVRENAEGEERKRHTDTR